MNGNISLRSALRVLNRRPQAVAAVKGSSAYPNLTGSVQFYQMRGGVLVAAEVTGLPQPMALARGVFAFHIHSGTACSGTAADPFADALTHYNPEGVAHPYHAGDMPPLFGNHGKAFQVFFTDRFSVREIVGKTVIIHSGVDDFTSQPAGNAGKKIACGVIEAVE